MRAGHVWVKRAAGAVRLLVVAAALGITATPLCAAEPEMRVLFLHGADATAPAQLIVDRAMRDKLAGNRTRQFQFLR